MDSPLLWRVPVAKMSAAFASFVVSSCPAWCHKKPRMAVHYALRAVALLTALVSATPSPQNVHADLTILMNNDLLGVCPCSLYHEPSH